MAWAPDYVTDDELKSFVRIDDDVDDVEVAWAITTASRAVDRTCHRQFGLVATPELRYYTARYDRDLRRWVIEIDDLMTTTGLVVMADLDGSGEYASEIDEYALRPVNAGPRGKPWTELQVLAGSANQATAAEAGIEGLARWGWATVPTAVKQATALQTSRLLARRDSPFGIAGSPDTGSEMRLLDKVDPDVAVSLSDYVRRWGAR